MVFDIIVAIYNVNIHKVPVIKSMINKENINLILCDNSTVYEIINKNKEAIQDLKEKTNVNINYISMNGNAGLSHAYNEGLSFAKGDVVCIFDDDTLPSDTFLIEMQKAIRANGKGIYLPYIYSNDILLSPLKSVGPAIIRCKDPAQVKMNHLYAFNTGMTITRDIFSKLRFDDRLFVDNVDHAFCRDAHKQDLNFHIVPAVKLQQNYSVETDDKDKAIIRFKTRKNDIHIYYNNSLINRVYANGYLFYRALRSAIKYKTSEFFKV